MSTASKGGFGELEEKLLGEHDVSIIIYLLWGIAYHDEFIYPAFHLILEVDLKKVKVVVKELIFIAYLAQ